MDEKNFIDLMLSSSDDGRSSLDPLILMDIADDIGSYKIIAKLRDRCIQKEQVQEIIRSHGIEQKDQHQIFQYLLKRKIVKKELIE